MATTLVAERPDHRDAIERVLDSAFGPGRFAKTSERVRERGAVPEPGLSRVALNDAKEVVGVCRIWRVRAGELIYFLGPLAVDPAAQLAGLGLALVRDAVTACRAKGGNGVVLVGSERFFKPLGFSVAPAGRLGMPGAVDPARLLWLELARNGFSNVQGEVGPP